MKKITLVFVSVLALAITSSCSKDEEPTIEGKWTFATAQTLDANDQPTGDVQICAGINGGVDNSCETIKYDAMAFNTGENNGHYTDYPETGCDAREIPFTFKKTGNALLVDFGTPNPMNVQIMSITSTVLKLKATEGTGKVQITLNKG